MITRKKISALSFYGYVLRVSNTNSKVNSFFHGKKRKIKFNSKETVLLIRK